MDNLSGMIVFAKVVEAGSFSAAAKALRLSKSAVSKQVSRLEDRLGVRLLNRTTRCLSLTEVGNIYYQRSTRIIAEVEDAELAITRLHAEPRGTLRVNAPMSFGVMHLAPTIAGFMARYPELTVDMVLNDRLVDLVEEGYDVAVRISRLPDSSLIARRLAPSRLSLCAAPAYLERHGVPMHPRDLKAHNCLLYAYTLNREEWSFKGPQGTISVKVSGNFSTNNGEALRAAAVEGLGLATIPTFIVGPELCSGRLVAVLVDYERSDLSIYAVYPHSRHLSAKVRVFVDFLAQCYGPLPYWDAGL